jgi:hypothetical protein
LIVRFRHHSPDNGGDKGLEQAFRDLLNNDPVRATVGLAQDHGRASSETRSGRGLAHPGQTVAMTSRRFSPPWTVWEYRGISYIVRDANDFPVAYVYFESESGRRAAANLMTKDEARKIAANIAKLPELVKRARD